MLTFAQIVALLRSGSLTYADLTAEHWATLEAADAAAFESLDVEAVSTLDAGLREHFRTLRADDKTKGGADAVRTAKILNAVVTESGVRAKAEETLKAADELLNPVATADPAVPDGGAADPATPPADGDPVALPELNPAGVTAARGAGSAADLVAKRIKATRGKIPAGITAAIGGSSEMEASPGAPLKQDRFIADYVRAMEEIVSYSGTGHQVPYRAIGVVPSYKIGEGAAERVSVNHSAWKNDAMIEDYVDTQKIVDMPVGIAAAIYPVFCGPVQVSFDLTLTGKGGRPIYDSAVKIPSERGRFRFRPNLFVRRTQSVPPYVEWDPDTNTPDCAAFTCVQNSCVNTEREVRLRLFRMCFEHTNMQELTDPEGLRAVTQRNLIEFDRWLEQVYMAWFFAQSMASSTYYKWIVGTNTTGYGAIPDFVTMIFTILSSMGWNARYERGGYTAYIPAGLMDWLWIDEISAAFPNLKAEAVMEGFRRRGVNTVEYLDDPVLGGSPLAGPMFSIPTGGTFSGARSISVTTTNASSTLTVPDATLLGIGNGITGTGIPANTTIIAYLTATTVQLSANATASGTVTGTVTASTTSAPFGTGGQGGVALPLDSVNTVRIFLAPTQGGGWAVSETGVLEIGPDRVTQAMCDIVRTLTTRREAPFWRDDTRPIFTVDCTFIFDGARAGSVTPHRGTGR